MNIRALLKRKEKEPRCAAVIVAAGSSSRMGSDKIMLTLGDVPVIVRTARAFQKSKFVDEIIIVTRQDNVMPIADLCHEYGLDKVKKVICGGATRAQSCLAGVSEVSKNAEYIAIHDGARPFVTEDIILRTLYAAKDYRAAIPVVPVVDTVKYVEDNTVIGGIDREKIVRVQTPQIFEADIVKGALTKAVTDEIPVTDDSSAVEMMGVKIHTVLGDEDNIKLTTQKDMLTAVTILKQRGELL